MIQSEVFFTKLYLGQCRAHEVDEYLKRNKFIHLDNDRDIDDTYRKKPLFPDEIYVNSSLLEY